MKHGNKYSEYIKKLYRPKIEEKYLSGYVHLDHNEAPFSGFNGRLKISKLNQYPDPISLYIEAAKYYNVKKQQIIPVRGAEQGLQYVFNTFLGPGKNVIYTKPTFGMLDVFAYQNRAKVKYLDYFENKISLDNIKKLVTNNTGLVVISNPDNPTGEALSKMKILSIAKYLKEKNIPLLVDEVYSDYYFKNKHSVVDMIKEYENLIVVKSMSKNFGLAGLRVGFIISNEENISLLHKWRYMDEIDSLSCNMAIKVLKDGKVIDKNIDQVLKWKEIFKSKFPKYYKETKTNFIILSTNKHNRLYNKLKENGIIIRHEWDHPYMDGKIRFSVSDDKTMKKIKKIIKKELY